MAVLLSCAPAFAASGREQTLRANELHVVIDSRWAGGQFGGYCPVRIRVTNHGRSARELTFRFEGSSPGEDLPDVTRRVRVDPNATLRFTLPVPLICGESTGSMRVFEREQHLPQLATTLSVGDAYEAGPVRTAMLVVTTPDGAPVDLTDYERAVSIVGMKQPQYRSHGGSVRDEDHVVLPPQSLPDQWIDYSGLDVIAVSLDTFGKLSPAVRGAILKWTECGGTLIVHSVGGPAAESADLTRALELGNRRMQQADWHGAPVALNQDISESLANLEGGSAVFGTQASVFATRTNAWKSGPEAFWHRRLMLGRVSAFPGDAFEGRIRDWAWWLSSLEPAQRTWPMRHGGTSRMRHDEFGQFLIPGVGDVPVIPFLTMITLFTILIGPVNYFVLAARKQLYLLVVTIPVFAFVTSCSLFAYAVIADGFGVRSRVRSVTLLDQGRNTAITLSRVSLYAGLVPSSGLSFSPDTAVFPLWPRRAGMTSGTLDWTSTQHYTSGFLTSRTYAQFASVTHRNERGRLEIKPNNGGRDVSNGLRWTLQHVLVRDTNGEFWHAENVPAGASARLGPAQPDDFTAIAALLNEDASSSSTAYIAADPDDPYLYAYDSTEPQQSYQFRQGLMEQCLSHLVRLQNPPRRNEKTDPLTQDLPPAAWIALVKAPPDIDLGVSTTPSASFNVIFGWE